MCSIPFFTTLLRIFLHVQWTMFIHSCILPITFQDFNQLHAIAIHFLLFDWLENLVFIHYESLSHSLTVAIRRQKVRKNVKQIFSSLLEFFNWQKIDLVDIWRVRSMQLRVRRRKKYHFEKCRWSKHQKGNKDDKEHRFATSRQPEIDWCDNHERKYVSKDKFT